MIRPTLGRDRLCAPADELGSSSAGLSPETLKLRIKFTRCTYKEPKCTGDHHYKTDCHKNITEPLGQREDFETEKERD
jgi:hypothetical protein